MNTRQQLAVTIAEKTLDINDEKKLSQEIAAYLLAEHNTADLSSIIRDVIAYRAERGIVEATVVSAHALSASVKQEIEKLLRVHYPNAKGFLLNERVDENVVGGLRLEMVDQQLDFTVRSKLNTLKRRTAARKDI